MAICAGPIVQTAWVTDNLEATEDFLSRQGGAGRWTRFPGIEFGGTCRYRGNPADFRADISLTYLGDMQLELIQPLTGESIYHEFLASIGSGLHHICFETADMAATIEAADRAGVAIVQSGSMAGMMEFAYLDGAGAGVPFIEVAQISPAMRQIYAQIKEAASAPDQ